MSELNKSAITDHSSQHNHLIDWDRAEVVNQESNQWLRWVKEAIHICKEEMRGQVMNRGEGRYHLCHIYDHLVHHNST